jgi:UDP-N-acetyl-D-glucosamine/UDP-N-acetyl-D-galactosamine dehydrogenase
MVPHERRVAVIGLGYVGLPVAVAFARTGASVIAFDVDTDRIATLRDGVDHTDQLDREDLARSNLSFSSTPADLVAADFYVIAVPTPIDVTRRPDLSSLLRASEMVGSVLTRGDIVVYESTVYPGATEGDCVPVLERTSGLRGGSDFTVGYSPERINVGDRAHRFETVAKVIAGQDEETLDIIAAVYGSVVPCLHRAPSIKVAEAAKIIENTQRDVNVALMNEFSAICHSLDIDTMDVIAAAGTKWNFCQFTPGLVSGHCIGGASYYLTHRAEKAGFHPEMILSGRRINEDVGERIGRECIRRLLKSSLSPERVTVLGLTFKENVADIRNSKVADIVRELQSSGVEVQVHDPMAQPDDAEREYGIALMSESALLPSDAVILAVPHASYVARGWPMISRLLKNGRGLVMDVKAKLDRATQPETVDLWRL